MDDPRRRVSNCRRCNTATRRLQSPDNACGHRFLVVAWIFCSAIGAAFADEPLRLADCRLESRWPAAASRLAAATTACRRIGTRPDKASKELQLHVAVIPALRLKPAADPLFILSGGPGQAASDFYLSVAPGLRAHPSRPRPGAGRSARHRALEPAGLRAAGRLRVRRARSAEAAGGVRECVASLLGDPRYYTTSVAVRDPTTCARRSATHAESLRHLVRHARRATLHASLSGSRAHGDSRRCRACGSRTRAGRRDRSAAAIDSALQRCARDEVRSQFPDISAQFTALQESLRKEPVKLSIPHPLTGVDHQHDARRRALGAAVRLLSYADETVSTLPLLIHEAAR